MKGSLCKENCIMCPCIFVGHELPSDSSSIKMFGEDSHSFFFDFGDFSFVCFDVAFRM